MKIEDIKRVMEIMNAQQMQVDRSGNIRLVQRFGVLTITEAILEQMIDETKLELTEGNAS